MPPKKPAGGAASKKADVKKAERVIEDKTFGLKNRNKSKVVQKYVQSVTAHAKASAGVKHKTEAQKLAEAGAKKAAKDREEAELRMLFSQMQTGASKKMKAEEAQKEAEAARLAELAQGDEKPAWVEVDMTGKPIEEVIEYQRAKLAYEGKQGTKVTEETFKQWKLDKAEKRRKENEERVRAELAKKTKGKGLSVLSGRALFEYDASLFVDDDEAAADKVDVTQLKSLMEHDEEQEGLEPPPEGQEGGDGEAQGGGGRAVVVTDGDDGQEVAVAVQEALYLEDADDDLDGLDDDDDDDDQGGAAAGGGAAKAGGGKAS